MSTVTTTARTTVDAWLGIGVKFWAIVALILTSVALAAGIYLGGTMLYALSQLGNVPATY